MKVVAISCTLLGGVAAHAQDLVYTPINPSFGGDPFNSSHLLAIANAQNEFDDRSFEPVDPIQQFADSVQRRILSQVAFEITDRIFGEDAEDSGTFTVGDARIDFQRVGDQVVITLLDVTTGAETVLEIPTPQF